jgi:hypothetical protein
MKHQEASKIYGMTGLAFLFILDEGMVQPNAGPQPVVWIRVIAEETAST